MTHTIPTTAADWLKMTIGFTQGDPGRAKVYQATRRRCENLMPRQALIVLAIREHQRDTGAMPNKSAVQDRCGFEINRSCLNDLRKAGWIEQHQPLDGKRPRYAIMPNREQTADEIKNRLEVFAASLNRRIQAA